MIVPQEIYHPLYEDKEKFIILITGGRGSGKSFNASTFIERLTFEMTPVEKIVHQILYTRYTMVSAGMSIIPEMMEKIDLKGEEAPQITVKVTIEAEEKGQYTYKDKKLTFVIKGVLIYQSYTIKNFLIFLCLSER